MVPGIKEMLVLLAVCLSSAQGQAALHDEVPAVEVAVEVDNETLPTISAPEPIPPVRASVPTSRLPSEPPRRKMTYCKDYSFEISMGMFGIMMMCMVCQWCRNVEDKTEQKLPQEVQEKCCAEFRRETGPEQMKKLEERIAQLETRIDLIRKAVNVKME
jgi:hypothetical protein